MLTRRGRTLFLSFYFLFCSKSFKKCIDLLLCCVIIESSKGKQLEKIREGEQNHEED